MRIKVIYNMSEWMEAAQSCLTLCDPMDYTAHGILQVRILEWVAFPFSRGSSWPRKPRSPALQADSLPLEPIHNQKTGVQIWISFSNCSLRNPRGSKDIPPWNNEWERAGPPCHIPGKMSAPLPVHHLQLLARNGAAHVHLFYIWNFTYNFIWRNPGA